MYTKSTEISMEEAKVLLKQASRRIAWLDNNADDIKQFFLMEAFGEKEDKRQGFGIFITTYSSYLYAYLLYLEVEESRRLRGTAKEIMNFAREELGILGYDFIYSEAIDGGIEKEISEKLGFAYCGKKVYSVCSGTDLINSQIGQSLDKMDKLLDRVFLIDDIPVESMLEFRKEVAEDILGIDIYKNDPYLSKYYVNDGRVLGYMAFTENEAGDVAMTNAYIVKDNTDNYVIPTLIASLIRDYEYEIEEKQFCLFFNSKKIEEAMEKAFGAPLRSTHTFLYKIPAHKIKVR